ncbi:MAG: sugar transferase, partial [Pyrinomonadaceae bacterium]|nr:sugar transferase [Pyrinomonadaceae bacterium]
MSVGEKLALDTTKQETAISSNRMKTQTAIENTVSREKNRVPLFVMPCVRIAVFLLDGVLSILCFALAFAWRENKTIFAADERIFSREFAPYAAILPFVILIRLTMFLYQHIYKTRGAFSYTTEIVKIFKAVSVGSLLIIAVAFLFRGGFEFRNFSYSRGVFLLDFALAITAFSAFHLALRYAQTVIRKRDINLIPTLVVGSGTQAVNTIRELKARPDLGYRIVGIIPISTTQNGFDVPIVGDIGDLSSLIKELAIQEVVIADDSISHETLFDAMMKIGRKQRVEFRIAPSLFDVLPQKTQVEQIGVLPMVTLFREPLSDFERIVKRVSDVVISLIALVLLAPVWLIITFFIKFDSRGAILFRQERVGMDGRIFLCFKFRTMFADADQDFHKNYYRENIAGNQTANTGNNEKPVYGKPANDKRITRTGRFLRRSSLDELPQLLNVLRGEMSVVGAPPPIPYEVEEYELLQR